MTANAVHRGYIQGSSTPSASSTELRARHEQYALAMKEVEERIARLRTERRDAYAQWQAAGFLMQDLKRMAHEPGAEADLEWARAIGEQVEVRSRWHHPGGQRARASSARLRRELGLPEGPERTARVAVDPAGLLGIVAWLRRVDAAVEAARAKRSTLYKARPRTMPSP